MYKQAAEQNNKYSQYMLGWCYYYGQGVEKNTKEGIFYIKKAALQGNESARKFLKDNKI